MKSIVDENIQNIKKRHNSTNKDIKINFRFFPKDLNKANFKARLSDPNIEFNRDELKNKDLRCLNCYLIPFLTLNAPSHSINLNCNFGHTTKINAEEYIKRGYENNFSNLACNKCKTKIFRNEKNFVYCKECSEILCKICLKKHNNLYEDSHHMVHLDKFDNTCILHNEIYDYFCLDCKKNICQYCFDEFHNEHNLVDLDDINLKRKEIKKIKESYIKEKENYLNIPKILNELLNKLKEEVMKIVNSIKNEIKFKESIINTYENRLDNYNAIINFKNLEFNTEPFVIDKDIGILENIDKLIKYLNLNDIKYNDDIKNNEKKSPDRIKEKKKKILPKTYISKSINNLNNDFKANIEAINTNKTINYYSFTDSNINNNENNFQDIKRNSLKPNKIYKKNIINKKMNFNNFNNFNSNDNNKNFNNKENDQNKINKGENTDNKTIFQNDLTERDVEDINIDLSKITEDESSNQNNTNFNNPNSRNNLEFKKRQNITSKNEKEREKEQINYSYNVYNEAKAKKENKLKRQNNSINNKINYNNNNEFLNTHFTSNSTNNMNYVKSEAPNLKMFVKKNKSKFLDKNVDLSNNMKKRSKEINSQSQRVLNMISNDPFSLTKSVQINNQENHQENIIRKKILKNNKINDNKNTNSKKIINKPNNKKVKEKNFDESEESNAEEEDEEEEEEEEEEFDITEMEEIEDEEINHKKSKTFIHPKIPKKKKSGKKLMNKKLNNQNKNKDEFNFDKEIILEESDSSFRHKKIYPRPSLSSEKMNISEIYPNRRNNDDKVKGLVKESLTEKRVKDYQSKINIIRDININEFKPNGTTLKIKEADNTICSMLEVRDNIFACGFLLGQIDVYDVNYLYCLLTIYEHKSRVSNMVLLKDKSILTSSFDHTMKKIRITNNNSYIVDYVFNSLKNVVYKGIELCNSDIVSISFRGNIDIFKKNDKNNNYSNFLSHEIANEEIYNVIELFQNKEIAFSTDECLRFFSIDSYQNIGNVHLLEFAKGNNMIPINKNIMAVLLKHHLGLVNISQRQCIFKTSLGEVGKPECFYYLKDNTILVGMSNNQKENKNIEFIFKQFNTKMNKCKLIAEKMEIINKTKKDDYCRIITLIELKNGVIAYGTAGFEEFKLVGNISIID